MKASREEFSKQRERFTNYLDLLGQVAEHADRVIPMQNYAKGLLLPIERKSVEPMAARLAPGKVRQMHQSLHHIVAIGITEWDLQATSAKSKTPHLSLETASRTAHRGSDKGGAWETPQDYPTS